MIEQIGFYISHSWNDLRIGGKRSIFALLCIAAGVAAVVSLQMLGAMINYSLTSNLQELNRGDMLILPPGPGPERQASGEVAPAYRQYIKSAGGTTTVFTHTGILALETAVKRYDPEAEVYYRYLSPDDPLAGTLIETEDGTRFIFNMFLDLENYPLYGDLKTLDGHVIQDVIHEPTDIILSDNAAEDNDLSVGDQISFNGSDTQFTIRGIVDREAEAFTDNFFLVTVFGFYYMDLDAIPLFTSLEDRDQPYAAEVFVKLSDNDNSSVDRISRILKLQFPFATVRTTTDLRDRNSQVTSAINDLVLLMGVVSLLIGGIGIINTMLSIVARRITEIAVLKTIGLKARQVTILFLVEAIFLGILGSIIGCIAGTGLAVLFQRYGDFFGARLHWTFSYEAILRGFVLGIVMAAVFGFLPTLIAGQIRPGNVLRPSNMRLPKAGIVQTLVALGVIFVALGIIVWTILQGNISPDTNNIISLSSIGLMIAFAFGIGGAAIMPGREFLNHPPSSLNRPRLWSRWVILCIGMVVQTIFQGILFFAISIIIVALLQGKLTTTNIIISIIIAAIIGLGISIRAFFKQRSVFLSLGSIIIGFALTFLVGGMIGIGIGIPLYLIIHDISPTAWELIVDLSTNITLVEATFVLIMLMVAVLWFLITLTARVPAFGIPDIKISLRALVTNRNRVSATLLALVIGVLTLSLITMFATSLKRFFEFNLEENLGGNVIVGVNITGSNWQGILSDLESVLATSEGIHDYNVIANYQVEFVAIEKSDGTRLKRNQLIEQMDENLRSGEDLEDFLDLTLGQIDGRYVNRSLPDKRFEDNNRQLIPEDAGKPVVVVSGNRAVVAAGIEAGDYLIVNFPAATGNQPSQIRFEIVGVSDESLGDISSDVGSPIYAPINSFGNIRPNFIGGVVDIEEDQISAFRRRVLDEVESTFVIETRFLNQIVTKLINQFTSLPILVAILNLITGGAVIANSVALSTMERRREIGVMKSLGVQRERVLGMLLLENGLMGFLGGIIGVGASLLLLIFLWSLLFEGDLKGTLPVDTALILMVVCVGISLLAAILTAWSASGEKPLTVLRNE